MPAAPSKTALLIQPFDETSDQVLTLVRSATSASGVTLKRFDKPPQHGVTIVDAMLDAVSTASLVIADLTDANPNVMVEFGIAKAQGKPIIVIARGLRSLPPAAARTGLFLSYDLSAPASHFVTRLSQWIDRLIAGPSGPALKTLVAQQAKQHKVFISYSHSDREYLDRLLVHLRPLQREGHVEVWVDTNLRAGDRWKKEIEKALARATAAILLISADFMASDFITNNELPPLLVSAEERGTRIVPVVIKPSQFARDPNLKHFQSINDPKRPLALLSSGEQEVVYDSVAEEVERWMTAG